MISGSTSWGSASPSSQPILGNCKVRHFSLSFFSNLYSSCQNTVWWSLYQVWRLQIIKRATYCARGADIYVNTCYMQNRHCRLTLSFAEVSKRYMETATHRCNAINRIEIEKQGLGYMTPTPNCKPTPPKRVFFFFSHGFSQKNDNFKNQELFSQIPGSSLIESWSTSEKSERVEYKVRIDKEWQLKIDHFNFNVQRS